MESNMAVFQGKKIRKTLYNKEWWFSVVDVVGVLTDSPDAGAYWRKLKQRLKEEGSEIVTFCHELKLHGISFERQKPLPIEYKGIRLNCGYRMDIVVDNSVVVELKCVDEIMPVHEAQILTYLRLSEIKVGLIINFHTEVLKNGIKRFVL